MIVSRYIIREIAKPLLVGTAILAVVFASYRSAVNLTDAANGLIQASVAVKLIMLETLVALEVLLPTAMYLSVVVALGRLHNDSEMTALQAMGIGEPKILAAVLRFALLVAVLVATLSIFVRPWAYQTSYRLEAQSAAETDLTALKAGRFYPLGSTDTVLFAEKIDRKARRMKQVFVQEGEGDLSRVIYAQEAYRLPSRPDANQSMVFVDGHVYELNQNDTGDRLFKFSSLTIQLEDNLEVDANQSRRADSTIKLFYSDKPKEIAEFQWRLSTPLATVLLALLAVPLSRSSPRQRRHSGFLIATLVYALFFNVAGVAKTWVEQGIVGKLPGLWWVYAIPATLLLLMLWRPTWVLTFSRR